MPKRLIAVPNAAAIRQARSFLAESDWTVDGATTVRFHPDYCHMQPWVLAAIGAWALQARRHGVAIAIENPERARYAWRFGLDRYLGVDPGIHPAEHEEAGRFIPMRTLSSSRDVQALIADIVPMLHLDRDQGVAVQYVMSEMVR